MTLLLVTQVTNAVEDYEDLSDLGELQTYVEAYTKQCMEVDVESSKKVKVYSWYKYKGNLARFPNFFNNQFFKGKLQRSTS